MKGDGKDVLQRFAYFLIVLLLLSKDRIVLHAMSLFFWTWPQMFYEQTLYLVRPPFEDWSSSSHASSFNQGLTSEKISGCILSRNLVSTTMQPISCVKIANLIIVRIGFWSEAFMD